MSGAGAVTVYRLTKTSRVQEAFSGEGARLFGGRWNSPGWRVIYVSHTRALALLEVLVHVDASLPVPSFSFSSVEIDPADIEALPDDTFARRDEMAFTRQLGDAWLKSLRTPVLAVPSVIVPQETNYLINPAHPRFALLRPTPAQVFRFDQRLVPPSLGYGKPSVRLRS